MDELYTVDVASGQIRRVMHSPGLDFCPTWAPDRHRLAAAFSLPGEPRRIRILDLKGRLLGQLDAGFDALTEPTCSPDGTRIALAGRARAGERYELHVWEDFL